MIVYKGASGEVTLKLLPLILLTLLLFGVMSLLLRCKHSGTLDFTSWLRSGSSASRRNAAGAAGGNNNRQSPHSRRFYFMRRDGYAN